jgi:hypothetical protein
MGSAQASIQWNFTEDMAGVTGVFSGSLNLTGATRKLSGNYSTGIYPLGGFVSNSNGLVHMDNYTITGPGSFGSGTSFTSATSVSGDLIGISGFSPQIGLPPGYVSGAMLSGSVSFAGHSFSTLGVTPGSYVFSLPNDTATVNFGTAAVPEPSSALVFGVLSLVGAAIAIGRKALGA